MFRNIALLAPGLILIAHDAAALQMDSLLPEGIPGFGATPGVTILSRLHQGYENPGIQLGRVQLTPQLRAGTGYDSAPNGSPGGSLFGSLTPSLLLRDPDAGFGAYAAGTFLNEFNAPSQNTAGYTAALGERVQYTADIFTIAVAQLRAQQTGFTLDTISTAQPQAVTVTELRLDDERDFGMVTLTPDISINHARFDGLAAQDSTNYREGLTIALAAGGPARFVTLLHATESQYRAAANNADSYEALFGIADDATDLWSLRLLAGAAVRQPAMGSLLMAPVLEAALGWMPTTLDSLDFSIEREIDDPDQESANGYTLTQGKISIAHEYLRNVILSGTFSAAHAAYFSTPLVETLFNAETVITWHLNRQLTLNADYQFNDRQANFLSAANEHLLTVNLIWTF